MKYAYGLHSVLFIFWQDYLSLLFKLVLQLEQAGRPFVNRLVDQPPAWMGDKERKTKTIPALSLQTAVYTDMVWTV